MFFLFAINAFNIYELCRWAGDGWFFDDGAWQLRMTVNTTRRTDTAVMNHSPRVRLPLLPYTIQRGCSMSIQLDGLNIARLNGRIYRLIEAETWPKIDREQLQNRK